MEIERLQIRRIYLPAFTAPLQRDTSLKIEDLDEIISLLSNPEEFCKRELRKLEIPEIQLSLALKQALEYKEE